MIPKGKIKPGLIIDWRGTLYKVLKIQGNQVQVTSKGIDNESRTWWLFTSPMYYFSSSYNISKNKIRALLDFGI